MNVRPQHLLTYFCFEIEVLLRGASTSFNALKAAFKKILHNSYIWPDIWLDLWRDNVQLSIDILMVGARPREELGGSIRTHDH